MNKDRDDRVGASLSPSDLTERMAEIEKGQQLAGHFPNREALDRAERILTEQISFADAEAEIRAKYQQLRTVKDTATVTGLNQAAEIGEWVRAQIASGEHTNDHTTRVITQETDRWFKNDLTPAQIEALCAAPADTGDPKWDALIEGVVSRRLHEAGMKTPEWTRRTSLTEEPRVSRR